MNIGLPICNVSLKESLNFVSTTFFFFFSLNLESESSQRARLFGIGVSIGILSSFLANKHKVDKLNELLKQSENLVQDLQEELEMKDSLTVKELAVEDFESQDTQNDTFNTGSLRTFSPEEKHNHCPKEYYDQKKTDAESFSKIEAELAAELEMLELNMSSHKLSNTVEVCYLDASFPFNFKTT